MVRIKNDNAVDFQIINFRIFSVVGDSITHFSVMIAVIFAASVTSKAGL